MKKIILEEYDVNFKGADNKARVVKKTDKQLLKIPFNNFAIGGKQPTTYEFLKKIDALCDKIDKADKELLLEDADYKFLKENFEAYTNWNPNEDIRKRIINLGDKILSAEDVPVQPVKETKNNKKGK